MNRICIQSDKIILPGGLFSGYITAVNGVICDVSRKKPFDTGKLVDAAGLYVSPGFIDMHTHGGGGNDFMDGTAFCIENAVMAHLKHGTTTIIPTTLASSEDELFTFLDNFRHVKNRLLDGPYLHGVHLEGPYFNPAQAGAQDPAYIKNPCPDEYKRIVEYAKGSICRWSLAPELFGADIMGDYLSEKGIIPSIAHSDAVYADALHAFNHGYSLVTHLYCGMSILKRVNSYRYLGVAESALLIDGMDVEIIADGKHLPPELLRFIVKNKGADRIALVTDSMRAAGTDASESILGSLKNGRAVIIEDGVAKMPDRTSFAGSIATADRLVRTMHLSAGVNITDAVKMITATPARILGLRRKGIIAVNMDCDLVLFDDIINVKSVITANQLMM